jgi:hypothetical protein
VTAPVQPRGHEMIAMLETGLDVRKVITHRLPAEKFLEGFEIVRRGECSIGRPETRAPTSRLSYRLDHCTLLP